MSACLGASVRVEKFGNVAGWGSHFSLDKDENGYGGFHPECYIITDLGGRVSVYCHDGYLDPSHHVNNFSLPLGPRKELDFIEFLIGKRGVQVTAQRKAPSSFTNEKIPYQISTFFPLREASGFCSGKTLFIKENGVLNGQANRSGSGYNVTLLPQ